MLIQLTPTFLTAPGSLSVSAISQTTLRLTWTASSGANLAGYRVYVATDPNQAYTLLTSTAVGVLTYDHATLTGGSTRYYRVTAYDSNNNETGAATGFGTTIANDTTAPTAPVISATAVSSSTINLTLVTAADDASGIASYAVERSPNGSTGWTVLTSAAVFPYSATGLSASTAYYFRARATDASSNANVGPYSSVVNATTQSAGGPAVGITAQGVFSIATPDGNANHGARLVITRSSGTFAARPYGANAWLADFGDTAYVNGVPRTPMSVYADGAQVAVTPANAAWTNYGQSVHPIRLARAGGARNANRPNTNTQAWWYSTTGAADMKCELMEPLWPSGWGAFTNQRVYVSFWVRVKNASQIIANGKWGRINDGGVNYFYPTGSNTAVGNQEECGPYATTNSIWWRLEYYLDYDLNVWDIYRGYRYSRQIETFGTTPGPREWRGTSAYNAVSNRGGYLYTGPGNNQPFTIGPYTNALVATLGFDGQNGSVHAGQEIDIANFYVDPEWERFEISDSATWSLAPGAYGTNTVGTPREVQMRWSRDSSTQCTVYVNAGQFASLAGKYLWYVDDFKTATLVGQFT